ncbi:MAG: DUF4345 family protein [Pseudomonadota bacterium]
MIDLVNILAAILSIGIGAISWLAPGYTMGALALAPRDGSTMGPSEIRASAGALFVGLGIGALLIGTSEAYAMVGWAWAGAAIGRATSLGLDRPSTPRKWVFFAVEAVVGGALLVLNA